MQSCGYFQLSSRVFESDTTTRISLSSTIQSYEQVIAPDKDSIIKQMKELIDKYYADSSQEANSLLMELVDMLIDYSPQNGEKLLAHLREQRAVANDAGPGAHDAGPECTIYSDSQSVHNKEISSSTRKAAKFLVNNFTPKIQKYSEKDPTLRTG